MSKERSVTATVTAKGQVTIPAKVREALGIRTGDTLEIALAADGFVARPRRLAFEALRGIVRTDRVVTGADIDRWIAERRGRPEDDAQP
jgi:AbrB family looped-hinge helix DNA binding protein